MRLTNIEHDILQTLAHAEADCGAYVSKSRLVRRTPENRRDRIDAALRRLLRLDFVKVDQHGCAAPTELGAAALKSM